MCYHIFFIIMEMFRESNILPGFSVLFEGFYPISCYSTHALRMTPVICNGNMLIALLTSLCLYTMFALLPCTVTCAMRAICNVDRTWFLCNWILTMCIPWYVCMFDKNSSTMSLYLSFLQWGIHIISLFENSFLKFIKLLMKKDLACYTKYISNDLNS